MFVSASLGNRLLVLSLFTRTDAIIRTHMSMSWVGMGWVLHCLLTVHLLSGTSRSEFAHLPTLFLVAFHHTWWAAMSCSLPAVVLSCRPSLQSLVTGCSSWLCCQPLTGVVHSELTRLALYSHAHWWRGFTGCAIVGLGCDERIFLLVRSSRDNALAEAGVKNLFLVPPFDVSLKVLVLMSPS